MDQQQTTFVGLLDLRAAFDTVDLLQRLHTVHTEGAFTLRTGTRESKEAE